MVIIKKEFINAVIAFGDSGVRLEKRSQKDLVDLGIIALSSKDPSLLKLFEALPSMQELKRLKMQHIINATEKTSNTSQQENSAGASRE